MARVHHVTSSRTEHRCHAGHVIEPPAGYSWAAPGFRASKRFACAAHPFRRSQLTTSAVGEVYAAQEAAEDTLSDTEGMSLEDVVQAYEDFVDALTTFRDSRQEAFDAWENGNSEFEDRLQEAEDALGEVEGQFEPEEWEHDDDVENESYVDYVREQADAALELINGVAL